MPRHDDETITQENLQLNTLADLADGAAGVAIDAAIAAAVRDCEDRGGEDKKPRKVTVELEFKKVGEDYVSATVRAKTSIPPYLTKPTIGKLKVDGRTVHMVFNPNAANNPDQRTLDDIKGE